MENLEACLEKNWNPDMYLSTPNKMSSSFHLTLLPSCSMHKLLFLYSLGHIPPPFQKIEKAQGLPSQLGHFVNVIETHKVSVAPKPQF